MSIENRLDEVLSELGKVAGDMVWQGQPEERTKLVRTAIKALMDAYSYPQHNDGGPHGD